VSRKRGLVPTAGLFLGAIENTLDRRAESNRAELVSVIAERVRRDSRALGEVIADNERFFRDDFPGLVVEAVRRSETVRSNARIRRFAAILTHSLVVGPKTELIMSRRCCGSRPSCPTGM